MAHTTNNPATVTKINANGATNNGATIAQQVSEVIATAQQVSKRKPTNPKRNQPARAMYDTTIDRATNRKVAIVVIDSALRGFKQNAKAIYNNRANMAVARLLAEKNLNGAFFRDSAKLLAYIKRYGARYIDDNGAICHEVVSLSANTDKRELHAALGYTIRYNADKTTAKALQPARAWSVSQFINMVAHCRREEMKETRESAKAVTTDALTAQAYLRACLGE